MCQHFIESIFHYNEYEGHETFNKFKISDRDRVAQGYFRFTNLSPLSRNLLHRTCGTSKFSQLDSIPMQGDRSSIYNVIIACSHGKADEVREVA